MVKGEAFIFPRPRVQREPPPLSIAMEAIEPGSILAASVLFTEAEGPVNTGHLPTRILYYYRLKSFDQHIKMFKVTDPTDLRVQHL